MRYKEFIGSVEYSTEDNCYYGKIDNITDLVTFESSDKKTVLAAFKNGVKDYLALCDEANKKPALKTL